MIIHSYTSKFNRKQTDLHYVYWMLEQHLFIFVPLFFPLSFVLNW